VRRFILQQTAAAVDRENPSVSVPEIHMKTENKPSAIVIFGGGFIALCVAFVVIFEGYSHFVLTPRAEAEQARVEQERRDAERAQRAREQAQREKDPEHQARQKRMAQEADKRTLQFDVGALCQVSIRRRLNDPKSAEFDFVGTYRWQINPNGRVLTFPTLRASNAFGGVVRATFACEVDISDRRNLRITHLEQL
jgi:hypothetical protein